jgi:energy-coupling factor transporter ATP-binding protein EcfA2
MLPIRIKYSQDLIFSFNEHGRELRDLILRLGNSRWSSQKDITLTNEFEIYRKILDDFKFEIINSFSGKCIYCLNNAKVVIPIHPIEKNLEFPELCMDIFNIYALCESCHARLVVDYQVKHLGYSGKKLTTKTLLKKIPNVLMPTFEPTHRYFVDSLEYFSNLIPLNFTNKSLRLMQTLNNLELNYLKDSSLIYFEEMNLDGKISRTEFYRTLWETKYSFNENERDYFADLSFSEKLKTPGVMNKKSEIDESAMFKEDASLKGWKKIIKLNFDNFRCFDSFEVDLANKNALCLIGDNGSGKSSFLNAISFFGSSQFRKVFKSSSDRFSYDFSRPTYIEMSYLENINEKQDYRDTFIVLDREDGSFPPKSEQLPICFIRENRTSSNFIDDFKLLLKDDYLFEEVAKIFNFILELDHDEGLLKENDLVLLQRKNRSPVDLFETSSGARSIFYIIYNIIKKFPNYKRGHTPNGYIWGCVLIDEIELHLHPKWKLGIVGKMKTMYPDLLFVVTTHDPLVLHGLKSSEIAVVESNELEAKSIFNNDLPNIDNYTVDLILTSPYFGLKNASNQLASHLSLKNKANFEITYREKIFNEIYKRSLELNLKYTNEELALLVAENFTRVDSLD